jgi:hypothetical protein
LKNVFDLTLEQLGPKHGPKLGSVIRPKAGIPDQPGEPGKGAAEIAWFSLSKRVLVAATVGIGFFAWVA